MVLILFLDQTFDYMYWFQNHDLQERLAFFVLICLIKEKNSMANRNGLQIAHMPKQKLPKNKKQHTKKQTERASDL